MSVSRKRINKNNLLPWFLEDHGQLPDAYKKSCQKFFDKLRATSVKLQAASVKLDKHQAVGYYRSKQKGKNAKNNNT